MLAMRTFDEAPQPFVRLGGLAYLAIILLGLFGEVVVRGTLVVPGDPATTLANIDRAQGLWRAGLAGDLLMHVLDVPLIVLFYLLLRPVNRELALLAAVFNVVQTSVLVANKLTLLVPLLLSSDPALTAGLSPGQMSSLSALAISMHGYGFGIGLVFFGLACLVRGYLLLGSGYFPPILGVLLVAAGLSYLANSVALILAPNLAAILFPWVLVPALVGELALALWFVIRGVNIDAWAKRTGSPRSRAEGPLAG